MLITLVGPKRDLEPALIDRLTSGGYRVTRLRKDAISATVTGSALPDVLRDLTELDETITLVVEGNLAEGSLSDLIQPDRVLTFEEIEINPGCREVRVEGRPIALTTSEFALLTLLAKRVGHVFSRAEIVIGIKGAGHSVTGRSVDVLVAGLRRKLNYAARHLQTVRGAGYRLQARNVRPGDNSPLGLPAGIAAGRSCSLPVLTR